MDQNPTSGQPLYQEPASTGSLDFSDDSTPVSAYASMPQTSYQVDNSLEVHDQSNQSTVMVSPEPVRKSVASFSKRKAVVVSVVITVAVTLFTGASALFLGRNTPKDPNDKAVQVPVQDVGLENESRSSLPAELQGAPDSLLVAGDVITRGSLKLSNNSFLTVISTDELTANQSFKLPNASGYLCLDSNNCNFASLNQIAQLQAQLGQIVVPTVPPSSLVNNQAGAVAIQGASNQISVTTANGVIQLATPQDLAPISSPTFASLVLNGNFSVAGTVTIPLNCSVNANGGALTTNGSGQLICSDDDDAGGGGTLTTSGGTVGTIPVYTAAQNIEDSLISQALGTVTISGNGSVTGSLSAASLSLVTALSVPNGGTGQTTFVANGVIYGNGAGGLLDTAAPTAGQVLIGDGSGVPTFVSMTGDVAITGAGVTTIQANSVALGVDTTGNYLADISVGNGLSVSGGGSEGATPTVSLSLQANKGLEVDVNGLSLVDCGLNQVLKYNGANQWACAADDSGAPNASAFVTVGNDGTLTGERAINPTGNLTGTDGGANGSYGIDTVANPTFATSVTTPLLQSSGALSITPGGALTVGATSQTTLLQGSVTTITSSGAGNDIVLTSADQIRLTGFDCTAFTNGGTLTTDASGNVSCANDDSAPATTITGTGTANRIALFTGAQTVADSWLLQNGSTLELDNTRNLSLTGGNFSVTGTGLFTGLITANGGITVEPGDTLTFNGDAFTDLTGTGLQISSGSLQTTLGTSVDLTSEVTGILPVTNGGTGVNGSTAANGQLLIGNGSGFTLATVSQGTGITITNGAGSITVASTLGTSIESVEITDLTVTGADIADDTIALGTKTTGNYQANTAGGNGIGITGSAGEGWTATVGLSNLTADWSQTGAFDIILNNASSELRVLESAGATFYGTIDVGDLTADRTYTLPDYTSGTGTICLDSGNCASAGGGVTTSGGTANRIAMFNGAQTIADSWLLQNGSTLQLDNTRNLELIGGNLTLTSGNLDITGNQDTSGTVTFSALANGFLEVNGSGLVSVGTIDLGGDTNGNYVATITNGNGISGSSASEGGTPTIALGNLTANWVQSGAFDVVYDNAGAELRILESAGGTFYGTFDVGDLGADEAYTFLQGGTVVTSGNVSSFATTAVTAGGGLTGGGTTGALTLDIGAGNGITVNANDIAVVYGSAANTAVEGDTSITVTAGTNLTGGGSITLGTGGSVSLNVSNSPTFSGTVTVQGSSVSIGTASATTGSLDLYNASSAFAGSVRVASLGQATVYTLPDPGSASVNICLSTGNCAGAGSSVTATTPGTAGRLAVFTAGQNIASSWLNQNGSTLELDNTRNFSLLGGDLDITGDQTTSGTVTFSGLSSGFLEVDGSGVVSVGTIDLGGDTNGNYVATISAGSGIAGSSASEGGTPTISLGALTANWLQSGAFDIVLDNASSELRIMESAGGTFYATFDVGDLAADQTFTFLQGGTVVTDNNIATYATTAVTAGAGLINGGTVGSVTLDIGAGAGITVNANDIAVTYGSAANTAVEGDTTLTCPSGTGNLTGGGTSITLGAGGSCGNITTNNAVTFTTSVTTPLVQNAGLTVASTGANSLIFQTNGTTRLTLASGGDATFASDVNIDGGSLTVGTATQTGAFILHDGAGESITFTLPGLAASYTLTLPDDVGDTNQCLKAQDGTGTLFWDDCTGGAGGGLSGSGTNGRITRFTPNGTTIGDSSLTDDGTDATATGDFTIQGGDLTIGAAAQAGAIVMHDGDGETVTLNLPDVPASYSLTLPTDDGSDTECIRVDASGQLYFDTCSGGGSGTGVDSLNTLTGDLAIQGTVNQVVVNDNGTDTITLSLPQDINTTSSPQFVGLTLTGDLAVNGGDITSTGALNVTPGGALTLGVTGQTATMQGSIATITSNGAGNDIILNSADTIELQDSTNITGSFTVSVNADVDGTLNVGTANAFQVAANGNITTAGDLAANGGDITSTGVLNITPGGALTVGATGQTLTLQGSVTTITSNGAGNDIVLTSADQITLTGFNCTTFTNGGALTTDASGNISCSNDDGGGAAPTLQTTYDNDADGSDAIIALSSADDSIIIRNPASSGSDSAYIFRTDNLATGSTVTDFKNQWITSSGSFNTTASSLSNYGLYVNNTSTESAGANTLTNIGLYVNASGADTNYAALFQGGNVGIAELNPQAILHVDGTIRFEDFATCTALETDADGDLVCGADADTTYSAGNDLDLTGTTFDIESQLDFVSIINRTSANLTLQTTTSGNIVLNSAGTIELQDNTAVTGTLNVTSTATVQGASVTVGTASTTNGSLVLLNSTNANTVTIQPGVTSGNYALTLPTSAGLVNQCIKNDGTTPGVLVFANCNNGSGAGGSITLQDAYDAGNAITTTDNRNILFTLDNTATDSDFIVNIVGTGNIFEVQDGGSPVLTVADGGAVTVTGNLTTTGTGAFQGATVTVGAAALQGSYVIHDGDGETVSFTIDDVAANSTIKIPDTVSSSDTFCLLTLANCVGTGGGVDETGTNVSGQVAYFTDDNTITSDADFTFDGTNLTLANDLAVNGGDITSTGVLNLTSATTNAITLDSGTTGGVNVGTGSNAKIVTVGNTTTTSSLILQSGTGDVAIQSQDDINIGTNAVAQDITIGNATGATSVSVLCGTGTCGFGNNAVAHSTLIGSSTGTATTTINAGTGGLNLGNNGVANTIQIGNTSGGVSQDINIGNNATGGSITDLVIGSTTTNSDTTIQAGTGGLNINSTGTSVINIGTAIGSARTVNLGTATGAAQTVRVGSADTSSSLLLQSGTGDIAIESQDDITIGANNVAQDIVIGNSTGATSVVINCGSGACDFGTNAVAHTTTVGSTTGTAATTIQAGSGGINLNATATTASGTLAVQGATVTVGAAALQGSYVMHDGDGETVSFTIDDVAANSTIKIPDAVGANDTICLLILANCTGSGSGSTLQAAYNADADGSDARIDLTSSDGMLVLSNPVAAGSTGAYVLEVEQLATSGTVGGLFIDNRGDSYSLRVDDASGDTTPFVIEADGDVGIGTAAPNAQLHVAYDSGGTDLPVAYFGTDSNSETFISFQDFAMIGYDNTSGNAIFQAAVARGMQFNVNNDTFESGNGTAMQILSSGNIGIGTTSPDGLLELSGNRSASAWGLNGLILQGTAASLTDSSTAASGTATNAAVNSIGQYTLAATNASVTTTNAYGMYLAGAPISGTNQTLTNTYGLRIASTATVDGAGGTPTNSYGLYVDAPTGATNNYAAIFQGGNVGIGVAAPTTSRLEVQGSTNNVLTLRASDGDQLVNVNTSSNHAYIDVYQNGGAIIGAKINSSGDSYFNGGNLGIGTATPGTSLDILSAAAANPTFRIGDGDVSLPNYSSAGFNPALASTTIFNIAPASGTTGGIVLGGFTESGANSTTAIEINGHLGGTSPTVAAISLTGYKHDGGTNRTALASSEIVLGINNASTNIISLLGNGNLTGTGTATFQGVTVTVGAAALQGSYVMHDGDGETVSFTIDDVAANSTIKIPDAVGANDTICLLTLANCTGSGSGSTLQAAYNADADGSDAVIALTTDDDSIIIRNPASSGSDSVYPLHIDQLNTGAYGGVFINSLGTGYALRVDDSSGDTSPFVIASDGKVGIGTTTTSGKLNIESGGDLLRLVASNTTGSVQFLQATASGGEELVWNYNEDSDYWQVRAGSTARAINFSMYDTSALWIDTSGNIGINDITPDGRLDVELSSTNTTADTIRGVVTTVSDTGVVTTGTDITYGTQISVTRTGATGGTINTYGLDIQATSDNAGAGTSTLTGLNVNVSGADTNYAALFNGGNVGIGWTTPNYQLQVHNPTAAAASTLQITNNASGATSTSGTILQQSTSGNDFYINNQNGGNITLGTGSQGVQQVTLLSSGNLGIGDTTPAYAFTVGNGDLFGVNSSGNVVFSDTTHTISVLTETTANGAGNGLTITAGSADGTAAGNVGGALTFQGGNAAGSGNNDGGDVLLQGGTKTGSGQAGSVIVKPQTDFVDAFLVQTAAGQTVLGADTSNMIIRPGVAPSVTSVARVITQLSTGDTDGNYVGVAIGSDGLPIYTYRNTTDTDLMITKCTIADCSTSTTTQVSDADDVAGDTNVAIGADGLPVIAHQNATDGDVMVTKCSNQTCSSNSQTQISDADSVGTSVSVAIAKDGLPIISYKNTTDGDIVVTKCGNAACTSGNTTTQISHADDVGAGSSIAIGIDGLAIVSYRNATDGDLMITQCTNATCSTNSTTQVTDADDIGLDTSIAIGTDGLPVISHRNITDTDVMVTKCTNVSCSTYTSSQIVDAESVGANTSLAIGSDGLPIILYKNSTDGDAQITKCGNQLCTASAVTTTQFTDADSIGDLGNITIGRDGNPVIGYQNLTDTDVVMVHCANRTCDASTSNVLSGGVDLGTINTAFRSIYFETLNLGREGARVQLNDSGNFIANNFVSNANGSIYMGDSVNGASFNNNGSGKFRFVGAARNDTTVALKPEFDGATFRGDGTSNTGTLTSDFCSGSSAMNINSGACNTTETHTFYQWTHNETTDQDYDIYVRYRMPDNFDASATYGTDITFRGFASKSAASTDNKAELALFNASGAQCGATTDITNGTANQWGSGTIIGSTSGDSDCTAITAGSYVTFRIRMTANSTGTTGEIIRLGTIEFLYKSTY